MFQGDIKTPSASSYATVHSMLANVILDYPAQENESLIVSNLRQNYLEILEFAKDEEKTELEITNCDLCFQSKYKDMLKHIMVSDKNFPSNIDKNSLHKTSKDLTYTICKKI